MVEEEEKEWEGEDGEYKDEKKKEEEEEEKEWEGENGEYRGKEK